MPLKLGRLQDLPHVFPPFRDYSLEELVVLYLKVDVVNISLYLSIFYLWQGVVSVSALQAEVEVLYPQSFELIKWRSSW